jgi:hypothetical protein
MEQSLSSVCLLLDIASVNCSEIQNIIHISFCSWHILWMMSVFISGGSDIILFPSCTTTCMVASIYQAAVAVRMLLSLH